ncbi:MAG: FkbM family methyltransferase [Flavobacteriales bacterium]|nr:FkbM family methyltransferase [Flavobacteriales bacterium]
MIRRAISRFLHGPPSAEGRLINAASAFPRHTPHTFSYRQWTIQCTDFLSVAWQVAEIFGDERMRFPAPSHDPLIIDCGANVGISVMHQRWRHAKARIIAFEPDEAVFACLQRNLGTNGITGVECHRQAVWVHGEGVSFGREGADGGSILRTGDAVSVPSVKLRDVLISNGTVDLLKVDIEGAETEVLLDCGDALGGVQRLYVEYHSFRNRPQRLHELLALLAAQGFRYYLHRIGAHHAQPFMALADAEMDLQLDIHAIRK